MKPVPILALLALAPLPSAAEILLPHLFTDGAVLQRDREVAVWGWATAGKEVTVRFGGQQKVTKADDHSRWQVRLEAMPASDQGRTMSVTEAGAPPVEVKGLLVGEVWLASGQSNMEWSIDASRPEDKQIAASGPVTGMRIFQVPNKLAAYPQDDVDATWRPATPETVGSFSAVAYFFGRELAGELKVPIGIISSEWGGSRIEPWTPEHGFAAVPELAELHRSREPRLPGSAPYQEAMRGHLAATRKWLNDAEKAMTDGLSLPDQPAAPETLSIGHASEIGLYQAMIHPLAPYSLRGFLWYQGESNLGDGLAYRYKMEALIRGWRKDFDSAEAPFLFVQLAPFNYGGNREGDLPRFWCTQTKTLEVPHTGMAIINDIGNPGDIHPRNKSEVGRRLSLWALADTYGRTDLVKSGPLFDKLERRADTIIRFTHTGGALKTRDGKAPDSFEVAGDDGVFHPAEARIDGDTIVIPGAHRQVRFAWSQVASPNLVNAAGLPVSCFHSHWPEDPDLGANVALGKPHTSSDPNAWGWNGGLTDGTWDGEAGRCFATGNKPEFPKHATIDLGDEQTVTAVRIGTPNYGSTRTVAVSVSRDGKTFDEVGRHEFKAKAEDRVTLRFDPRPVRQVRVTFVDHHPKQDNYDVAFGFLREVEVYAPKER